MEITKSKLFMHTIIDVKDDFEENYERAFRSYVEVLNINENGLHELLSSTIRTEKQHEELSMAMIHLILTDPSAATKAYSEKYQRLNDIPRKQLLWFLKELIRNRVLNVDNIIWNILRQASGGDIGAKNIALVEGLLDIFIESRSWIAKDQFLIGTVVYSFLRYQDWFQEKYFTTPESQSLRSDLIRFIIGAIHPTNDMLCSDIIPRWAVIGWLLTSCTNAVAQANAKLSLFYDWLFFEPVKDNIMNIEPGILVMFHSIKNHPLVSCTLLDFLCRIMKSFYPKGGEMVRNGIYNSLRIILDKQVIPNLLPLLESTKLDRELRSMLRENFREFFSSADSIQSTFCETQSFKSLSAEDGEFPSDLSEDCCSSIQETTIYNTPEQIFKEDEKDAEIMCLKDDHSDDDDLPLSKVIKMEKPIIQSIPVDVLRSLDVFVETKNAHCFESLLTSLIAVNKLNIEQETYVYEKTVSTLGETLTCHLVFPESKSDEWLSESINHPLFNLFKMLFQSGDKATSSLTNLIAFTYSHIPSIGYLLLHYLKVCAKLQTRRKENTVSTFNVSVYNQFCSIINSPLKNQLQVDLVLLEKKSLHAFLWILPDLYKEYKEVMVNNTDIISLFVGAIDANNLRDVIFSITQGKLVMFSNDGIIDVIRDSLEYETFEQFCFWQLLQAHDVPLESFQDLLPVLDTSLHAEALTYILLLLKTEKPTSDLVKCLLSRECKNKADPFVISILRCWCEEYEGKLSEIIAGLLTSKYPSSSPNKRKRPLKLSSMQNCSPSSDQILHHLEHFRRSCRHGNGTGTGLYVQNEMQRSLQQAFTHSTDGQKKHFSDLFALAAEEETAGAVGRRSTSSRGRKPPASKKETSALSSNTKKNAEYSFASDDSTDVSIMLDTST
ncbi:integrator complex subunit 3 homolog isoform X2 [Topomyia yanbarensis]|uniref:integrator complex subunit 3 homolog isoform X2 n=1 Tax=Topomyia yanbarensis TaxID=2498891 RepID=UPI00273C9B4E|nr:integrator complex subunit 3 homolog isoform X2 [Topomyia yanbarensis]